MFTSVFDAQGNELVAAVNVTNTAGVDDFSPVATALADDAYALTWQNADQYHAIYQFIDVPLNEIQPPTNISNSGVLFEPQIATLPNGNYVLTYTPTPTSELVWTVFDPQGAPIHSASSSRRVFDLDPAIAPVTGGFALAWEDALDRGNLHRGIRGGRHPVLPPTAGQRRSRHRLASDRHVAVERRLCRDLAPSGELRHLHRRSMTPLAFCRGRARSMSRIVPATAISSVFTYRPRSPRSRAAAMRSPGPADRGQRPRDFHRDLQQRRTGDRRAGQRQQQPGRSRQRGGDRGALDRRLRPDLAARCCGRRLRNRDRGP